MKKIIAVTGICALTALFSSSLELIFSTKERKKELTDNMKI